MTYNSQNSPTYNDIFWDILLKNKNILLLRHGIDIDNFPITDGYSTISEIDISISSSGIRFRLKFNLELEKVLKNSNFIWFSDSSYIFLYLIGKYVGHIMQFEIIFTDILKGIYD